MTLLPENGANFDRATTAATNILVLEMKQGIKMNQDESDDELLIEREDGSCERLRADRKVAAMTALRDSADPIKFRKEAAVEVSFSSESSTSSNSSDDRSNTPTKDPPSNTDMPVALTPVSQTPPSNKMPTVTKRRSSDKSVATNATASTSLSKLEMLRARNEHLRRSSSQRIADVRKSLMQSACSPTATLEVPHRRVWRMQSIDGHASMRSFGRLPSALSLDPQERLSASAPQLQWDESTVETVSSRTFGGESLPPPPPPPIYGKSKYRHSNSFSSLPLREVVTTETPDTVLHHSAPSLRHSFSLDEDTRSMLQEENHLLKRQVSLLMEQKEWEAHVEQESKTVQSLRRELESKKQRRQRRQWKKKSIRQLVSLLIMAAIVVAVGAAFSNLLGKQATPAFQPLASLFNRIGKSLGWTSTEEKRNKRFSQVLIDMKHDTLGVWLKNRKDEPPSSEL
jgi:hypothetical protein